ncbi:unnamed protein product [Lampetra planeri]
MSTPTPPVCAQNKVGDVRRGAVETSPTERSGTWKLRGWRVAAEQTAVAAAARIYAALALAGTPAPSGPRGERDAARGETRHGVTAHTWGCREGETRGPRHRQPRGERGRRRRQWSGGANIGLVPELRRALAPRPRLRGFTSSSPPPVTLTSSHGGRRGNTGRCYWQCIAAGIVRGGGGTGRHSPSGGSTAADDDDKTLLMTKVVLVCSLGQGGRSPWDTRRPLSSALQMPNNLEQSSALSVASQTRAVPPCDEDASRL